MEASDRLQRRVEEPVSEYTAEVSSYAPPPRCPWYPLLSAPSPEAATVPQGINQPRLRRVNLSVGDLAVISGAETREMGEGVLDTGGGGPPPLGLDSLGALFTNQTCY